MTPKRQSVSSGCDWTGSENISFPDLGLFAAGCCPTIDPFVLICFGTKSTCPSYLFRSGQVMSVEEYRHHAAQCVYIAQRTTDMKARASLIARAQAWWRLADKAGRNMRPKTDHETRPTSNQSP